MPLICPECKQLYEQNGVCPLCNVVLLYHASSLQTDQATPISSIVEVAPQWQQTPWGKILVGLILAQGLSFGLLQVLTAGFLASGDGTDVWQTLWGIVPAPCVHAVSLIIGGALDRRRTTPRHHLRRVGRIDERHHFPLLAAALQRFLRVDARLR